ncbi:hypothetical protein F1D05_05605 [Kribbella qitaiheensis]|uniref:Uncharacterized protein n=1 Tax=Kribbella qitaiheensis TaxID=1544730 RepID=A0A7G6WU15_9ACTN|nr:hypothetical protein [Kribbella qitaiheensis]QNE17480.1 hypothetical protein F1D05_05605 [Kribbella qitaiheensis]
MIRRTLATVVAAVGIAALLPLTASAADPVVPPRIKAMQSGKANAQVAGSCALSVPNRIAIGRDVLVLKAKVSGPCAIAGSSSLWNLNHPSRGDVQSILFDSSDPDGNGTYAFLDEDPLGNQTWQGRGSFNADGSQNTQNNVPITVKLAAGAWISSSRTADVVTLKGTSLLYSVTTNSYFKRSAGGVFQFREQGSTTWQTLKSVYTNSKGEVTMAYRYSKTRDYRFSLYSTSISWDLGSAVTTR